MPLNAVVLLQDALDKELRKAKRCKDPFIDSSLIHGASQRFQPKVLVANLEREIGKDTTKVCVGCLSESWVG